MQTITFKAPDDLCEKLEFLATELDRNKSYLIRQAIAEFIEEKEDYLIALKRLAEDKPGNKVAFEEIKKKFDL